MVMGSWVCSSRSGMIKGVRAGDPPPPPQRHRRDAQRQQARTEAQGTDADGSCRGCAQLGSGQDPRAQPPADGSHGASTVLELAPDEREVVQEAPQSPWQERFLGRADGSEEESVDVHTCRG